MRNSNAEFARWISPLLAALQSLGGSAQPREAVSEVARAERVSDAVLDETLPSGGNRFENQVHWARYYLAEAGYIDRSKRGVWKLTEKAQACGLLDPAGVARLLRDVQSQVVSSQLPVGNIDGESPDSELAPEPEGIDYRGKLIQVLRTLPPAGFERLCQRLLREAGFESVEVTGRSNDGGIDGHGVLSINPLVSFKVIFQCKRYTGAVGSGFVRDFRGAMQGRAEKGLILTTGNFTAEAKREASRDGVPPIELVDGDRLIELFSSLELGLTPITTFEIDDKFFAEFSR